MIRALIKTPSRLLRIPTYQFATEEKAVSQKVNNIKTQQSLQKYVDGQLVTRTAIILKKEEDIESYVLNLVKNYFRTTNRANLALQSKLEDHGLDSLDSIELSMQIEEDLGYVISAETLPVLNKVIHYVNYIRQVEQFKQEFKKSPLT